MHTCAKMVPLITKWGNYIPRKGVKLEIANSEFFFSFFCLFWLNSHSSLTAALTHKKLGREMKLCDPTNNIMFKNNIGLVSSILLGWELHVISLYYVYKAFQSCLLCFFCHPYIPHSNLNIFYRDCTVHQVVFVYLR